MKLFDPRAELAKIEKQGHPPASSASFASFSPHTPPKEAEEAKEATPRREIQKTDDPAQKPETPDFRHGKSVCGWPKTWTGKIVSLDEWRTLSAWDKHGPDGRHWNGITRKWEELA